VHDDLEISRSRFNVADEHDVALRENGLVDALVLRRMPEEIEARMTTSTNKTGTAYVPHFGGSVSA
jgi:hypothetical protein